MKHAECCKYSGICYEIGFGYICEKKHLFWDCIKPMEKFCNKCKSFKKGIKRVVKKIT